MNVLITETQYIKILKENKENEIEQIFSSSKEFTNKIVSDVKKQYNLDFTFMVTWGSVIGGFARPIAQYMEGLYPNLTQDDISLIMFGIILTFFSSNKEKLNKVGCGFCLAKWTQVTMHLNNGYTHSCHHPSTHKIPLNEIANNPSALHNTSFKKQKRKECLVMQRAALL